MIIIEGLKNIYRTHQAKKAESLKKKKIKTYLSKGQIPWTEGYQEFKQASIEAIINNNDLLNALLSRILPTAYGYRLDERIVEYAWIFAHLKREKTIFLDAGSTFNFEYIVYHSLIKQKELNIYTYYPESPNFLENRISYIYGDLRSLPFKDDYFEEIVSQSTIEHIDMDNSIYGYSQTENKDAFVQKSYEYLKAVREMVRVLKPNGTLLLTFPYGKFENHGFFQQFDSEMLHKLLIEINTQGVYKLTFFKYLPEGWIFCEEEDCQNNESYNPHTGRGKGTDGAAHCRSICCVHYQKNN